MPFLFSDAIGRILGNGTDLEKESPSQGTIVAVQATGAIIAGVTASCITTPMDTIKTRLQVQLNLVGSNFLDYLFFSLFFQFSFTKMDPKLTLNSV